MNAHFQSTSWTLLEDMLAGGAKGQLAHNEFVKRYRDPVFRYLRAIVRNHETADDLTQDFFLKKIIAGDMIKQVDKSKAEHGFRPFLKTCLVNHAVAYMRRHPEEVPVEDQNLSEFPDAEREFHDASIRKLVDDALALLRQECEAKGQTQHYKLFHARYIDGLLQSDEEPSWKVLGAPFGIDERTARNRAETACEKFRRIVFTLAVQEVGSDASARKEFDFLRSAASTPMVKLLNLAVADN
jgi:RNA polymerase sigma factor (sigma-70 family)